MSEPWRVYMFGGLRAERGEHVIKSLRSQKVGALFAYLASKSDHAHPREVLIEMAWPDVGPDAGRNNLRVALSRLRKRLEPAGVEPGSVLKSDRLSVHLNPEAIQTDIDEFEQALKSAATASDPDEQARHFQQAVDVYRGEYLAGFYDDWVLAEQRRYADQFFQAVCRLAGYYRTKGESNRALDCARRAVEANPLDEDAHQEMIRILLDARQPFAALHQLRELERVLKVELDESPSDPTQQLAHEIEARIAGELAEESNLPTAVMAILVGKYDMAGDRSAQEGNSDAPIPAATATVLRRVLAQFSESLEIAAPDHSFVLGFPKPSDSIRFALTLQSRMRRIANDKASTWRLNIGIHLTELLADDTSDGDERAGINRQIELASTIADLAADGQILVTPSIFDTARQTIGSKHLPGVGETRWISHGPYLLRSCEETVTLCEVGEEGVAPLRPPADCEAGKSVTVSGAEPLLGWRPAIDQVVPGTDWVIEKKLGEGGFGEVWRARDPETNKTRVFKFCFRADRLRALKREMTLFRLLREQLGDRPDIARLYSVQFEEAPYYLELEDTPGGNLAEWFERRGGCKNVPLETRLKIVAQVATALAAAHSVGVIHRDIKPSNILIDESEDRTVQARLTDLGIGEVTDRTALANAGITVTGFTETISSPTRSGYSGSRLYMAPELLAGRPPTTQSDIYSLGVLLYQLLVGDLSIPLATGWEGEIRDPLLREDLHRCVAGSPASRFQSAADVARRLRALPRRRKRRRWARAGRAAAVSLAALVLLGIIYSTFQFNRRRQAEVALARETTLREQAERESYYAMIGHAAQCIEGLRFAKPRSLLASCPKQYRHWEWGRLLYLCNLDMRTLEGHSGAVPSVAFSPDGKHLATASHDGTAKVWDVETGREIRTFRGHSGWVLGVAFGPNGEHLATACMDTTSKVWDVKTGRELLTLKGHSATVYCVTFSPDGSRIATSSFDCTAKLWDAETGRQLLTLRGHEATVRNVAFGPSGRYLATAGWEETCRLWDAATGRELFRVGERVDCVAVSPDGKRLATGSLDGTASVWDVETGRKIRTLREHSSWVYAVAFGPDGKRLLTGSLDRTAKVWDLETGQEILTLRGHSADVRSAAFSPDGRLVATASHDGTAKLWSLETHEFLELKKSRPSYAYHASLGFHGNMLAVENEGGEVELWDAAAGHRIRTLDGTGGTLSVAFSPDGKRLAVGCEGGRARIWDLEKGTELLDIAAHTWGVGSVAFSPDGTRLATASSFNPHDAGGGKARGDMNARIWDVDTGQLLRTTMGHSDIVNCVSFSPDGTRLATGSTDGTARLWGVETGQEMRMLDHGDAEVNCVVFGPDGQSLVTGTGPGTVVFWDMESGRRRRTLHAHDMGVNDVAFSPDGKRLATGSVDGTAKIWDVETGREVLTYDAPFNRVLSVAFNRDGRYLAMRGPGHQAILLPCFPWKDEEYPGNADMPFEQRLASFKLDYWRKQLAAMQETSPTASAQRILNAPTYSPSVPIQVQLKLVWNADASSITVSENAPEGWRVSKVSHGGTVAENSIAWKVAPWTSPGVALEYTITPPADAGCYPAEFVDATVRSKSTCQRIENTFLPPSGVLLFQNGAFPTPEHAFCRDAHILNYRPDFNTGGCEQLEVGNWREEILDRKKMVVRFDLFSVPSTFSLGRAEIRLYAFDERQSSRRNRHAIYATRLLKPWGEGQGLDRDGEVAQEGDITFNSARQGVEAWERPGAMGVTDVDDWESSVTAGERWPEWVTLDVTESVRFFLEAPEKNYGWKISQDPVRGVDDSVIDYVEGAYVYKSSEAPEVHLRPMLILVPEKMAATTIPTQGAHKDSSRRQALAEAEPDLWEGLFALRHEFEMAHGPYRDWGRLPELARKIANHPAADAGVLNSMACAMVERQRRHPGAALELAKGAIRLCPTEPHILDTLAWAETLTGEHAKAVTHFAMAIEEDVEVSLAGLAIALARLGQVDRAWGALARAIERRVERRFLIEAYFEANKAGRPSDEKIRKKAENALGPVPPPEFELIPSEPSAGEKVIIRYCPWSKKQANAGRMFVTWGINRWKYPGDESAAAEGVDRVFRNNSMEPAFLRQEMSKENGAWTATLWLPPSTRQIDLTFLAETSLDPWQGSWRNVSIPVSVPRRTDDPGAAREAAR